MLFASPQEDLGLGDWLPSVYICQHIFGRMIGTTYLNRILETLRQVRSSGWRSVAATERASRKACGSAQSSAGALRKASNRHDAKRKIECFV